MQMTAAPSPPKKTRKLNEMIRVKCHPKVPPGYMGPQEMAADPILGEVSEWVWLNASLNVLKSEPG